MYFTCILHVTLQSMDFTLNDGSLKLILVVFSSKGLFFVYVCSKCKLLPSLTDECYGTSKCRYVKKYFKNNVYEL